MAYNISSYVGRVAAAGKKEYDIPFYTNTWLNFDNPSELDMSGTPIVVGGGAEAGVYPSGGPCPHMLDIWRFNTPSLDFLAPDLYFHDYELVCKRYSEQKNPLFIPEQRRDENGARRLWLSYGTYGALGASPFGIDTGAELAGREFRLLNQIKPYLLTAGPDDRFGFYFDEEKGKCKEKWTKIFGDMEVIVERAFVFGKAGPGGGLVIHLGNSRFLAVGRGFNVSFKSTNNKATFTGILRAEEKEVDEQGELRTLRVLNGDETRSGEFLIMPNDDPDYGGFPIAVTIPARTCIAELEATILLRMRRIDEPVVENTCADVTNKGPLSDRMKSCAKHRPYYLHVDRTRPHCSLYYKVPKYVAFNLATTITFIRLQNSSCQCGALVTSGLKCGQMSTLCAALEYRFPSLLS
uniref:DUF5597 domain-containing protein n=1 Tax=Bionectria ochroleuca TaxID=29856 RepID=A0A8H7TPK9_BIOOC